MKTMSAILAVTILIGSGAMARAGVVIDEQVTTTRGSAPPTVQKVQELVQGHQKKFIRNDGSDGVIMIDLDKKVAIVTDPAKKMYFERPLPPEGSTSGQQLDVDFKTTGKSSKILSYECREYEGKAKTAMAEFSAHGCFSTSAPGAAEYSAFNQAAKGMAPHMPDGIPLTLVSTTKIRSDVKIPGLTDEQMARLQQMNQPQVAKRLVTKIATANLPASTFSVPAGYTRGSLPTPGSGTVPASPATRPQSPE